MASCANIDSAVIQDCRLKLLDANGNAIYVFDLSTTVAFTTPVSGNVTIKDGTPTVVTLTPDQLTAFGLTEADINTAAGQCSSGGGSTSSPSNDPQIEGLHLLRLCDITSGETVGYVSVIHDEATNTSTQLFFDTNIQSITAAPANSEVCRDSAASNIKTICKVDDVAGDGSGDIINFVKAYSINVEGTTVTSTFLGDYTDESLTTPYTLVGTERDPSEIGEDARLKFDFAELSGSGTWTPPVTLRSFSVFVTGTGGQITGSSGTTRQLNRDGEFIQGVDLFGDITLIDTNQISIDSSGANIKIMYSHF